MTFLEKFSRKLGVLEYLGLWDASSGSPPAISQRGGYYIVSVGGTYYLSGIAEWDQGDWAIYNGTEWQRINTVNAALEQSNGILNAIIFG